MEPDVEEIIKMRMETGDNGEIIPGIMHTLPALYP
jgi:hypothetical protein